MNRNKSVKWPINRGSSHMPKGNQSSCKKAAYRPTQTQEMGLFSANYFWKLDSLSRQTRQQKRKKKAIVRQKNTSPASIHCSTSIQWSVLISISQITRLKVNHCSVLWTKVTQDRLAVRSSDLPPRSQTLGSSLARAPLITMTRKSILFTSQLPGEENFWRHVIQWFPLFRPPIFLTAKS